MLFPYTCHKTRLPPLQHPDHLPAHPQGTDEQGCVLSVHDADTLVKLMSADSVQEMASDRRLFRIVALVLPAVFDALRDIHVRAGGILAALWGRIWVVHLGVYLPPAVFAACGVVTPCTILMCVPGQAPCVRPHFGWRAATWVWDRILHVGLYFWVEAGQAGSAEGPGMQSAPG